MKLRFSVYVGAALAVLCFTMISIAGAPGAGQKATTYEGEDKSYVEGVEEDTRIVLTITEYKPGEYTVTGTFYRRGGQLACPVKGTYYERKNDLKATARDPKYNFDLNVDGMFRDEGSAGRAFYITVKAPSSAEPYFSAPLRVAKSVAATAPEAKPAAEAKPSKEEGEIKIPAVEGNEPSPADKQEDWNGRWKGKTKSTVTVEGIAPVVREGEFEFRTIREGQKIRIIGADREFAYDLTPSNPNAAMFKEKKKETFSVGWADVTDKRVIFLRDGRLYLTIHHEVTGHTTIPNMPDKPVTEIHDTIGIADRVK